MTQPKRRVKPVALATIMALAVLAACQERKPTQAQTPSASSGEYPTPTEASLIVEHPAVVPGQGAEVTVKGTARGMAGGASGTGFRRHTGIRLHERSRHRCCRVRRREGGQQEMIGLVAARGCRNCVDPRTRPSTHHHLRTRWTRGSARLCRALPAGRPCSTATAAGTRERSISPVKWPRRSACRCTPPPRHDCWST